MEDGAPSPRQAPNQFDEAVRSVAELHSRHRGRTSVQQRVVNQISEVIGRPSFLKTSYVQTRNDLRTRGSERVDKRDIRRVPASRDDDPAYPRNIVARIECPPRPGEEHLYPGAEIHRINNGHANVAEMAVDVTSRNVEASAKRHGEMGEIAADFDPLVEGFKRGSGRSRLHIVKLDMPMHKIANRLHATPAGGGLPEHVPRRLAQLVGLAISTSHQIKQA